MTDWTKSTYLDYAGYGLTLATPGAGSGQSATEAAFGITDGHAVTDPNTFITLALTLNRTNDPSTLLSSNWAVRQQLLKQAMATGGVGQMYGATQADYQKLVGQLASAGISVVPSGNLSSAESRTVWVTLSASQFQTLFGTQLMTGTSTIGPANFTNSAGSYTPATVHHLLYWNGNLNPTVSVPLAGLWIENGDSTGNVGETPTPVITSAVAVSLANGSQGVGNALTHARASIFPSQLAQIYGFPLSGTTVPTPTVGLVENGAGNNTGVTGQTIGDFVQGYLQAARTSGTVAVSEGTVEEPTFAPSSGERSLDVSVVAAASPNSNQILYAGDGSGSFSSMQEAIWDAAGTIGTLSSSFSESERPAPGSPFYAAYEGLMQDAALRNITLFMSAGDGGSSEKIGNGIPLSDISHDSPYAVVVGGTSLSTQKQAVTDSTIAIYASAALAGNRTTLRALVAEGLKTLPTSAGNIASFIETTWNEYTYGATTNQTNGLTANLAGAGGIDSAFIEPSYQLDDGIDAAALSYDGQETGRGIPDVAAMSGGNNDYTVIPVNGGTLQPSGGTSASAPLWAALTAQIQAIFTDQGLPTTGYFNDLLYTAAAVAPASFNDVSIGGNTSSFVYGGTTVDGTGKDGAMKYDITPTGLGYSAAPGYDLTTGLGTPNGTVLARALTQIAQAQMFSAAPGVTDDTGLTAGATGVLLVQTRLAAAGTVSVTNRSQTAEAINGLSWTDQFAQQSLQSGFDPALVNAFDFDTQGATTQVAVSAGQTLDVSLNGAPATALQPTLTSPFGFVTYGDAAGNALTLARPVAIAQTALGAGNQQAIVRIRQNGMALETMRFYKVDDLSGSVGGLAPGQAGYAEAAAARSYKTADGTTGIDGPGYGNGLTVTLAGVNAGDIIASELISQGHNMWAFAGQNESSGGAQVNHIYNYGLNTWGYEDTTGGGDHDFNDMVFQIDFTSASGHGYLAES